MLKLNQILNYLKILLFTNQLIRITLFFILENRKYIELTFRRKHVHVVGIWHMPLANTFITKKYQILIIKIIKSLR